MQKCKKQHVLPSSCCDILHSKPISLGLEVVAGQLHFFCGSRRISWEGKTTEQAGIFMYMFTSCLRVLVELNLVLHSVSKRLYRVSQDQVRQCCHRMPVTRGILRNPMAFDMLPTPKDHKTPSELQLSTFIFLVLLYIQIYRICSGLHFTRCLHLAPRVAARAKSARMVSGWKPFTFGASNRFNDIVYYRSTYMIVYV